MRKAMDPKIISRHRNYSNETNFMFSNIAMGNLHGNH